MHAFGGESARSTPAARCRGVRRLVRRLAFPLAALAALVPCVPAGAEVTNPHGLAVIIGNRSYSDVPPVDFAHRDAAAFRHYVVDVLGFAPKNVIHIEDATRRRMLNVFGSPHATMSDLQARLYKLAPEGGSDVVVYYSGHGLPGREGGAALLPADVPPHEALSESYPLDLLYEKLGALQGAKTVRVFLEACFSGGSDGGRLVDAAPVYQEPAYPESVTDNMVILTAVTGTQLATWDASVGHGLFTHHLLDALYGKADADGDGDVTAREAQAYLDRHMRADAWLLNRREQNAVLTAPRLAGLTLASAGVGGEFPQRPELSEAESKAANVTETPPPVEEVKETAAAPSPEEVERALGLTHGQRELVQHGLVSLGYEIGRVDGVLGARSRAGIRAYQTGKGLEATGRLTAQVSEALQALGRQHEERVRAAERERREQARLERERLAREKAERERLERERRERERASREPGRRFRDCEGTWCPDLVVVGSGSYMMGSPESEEGRQEAEGPRHRVTIGKAFAVGVTEVTRGQWRRFVEETGHTTGNACWTYEGGEWKERSGRSWRNPGFSQGDGHPVVCVSWEDARAYVRWLSRETGERYRLLSESEWEYVARGGTSTARYWGEREAGQCRHANGADGTLKVRYRDWKWTVASCDDRHVHTSPVGSYERNGFGLYDVLGNVWEWVEDCWHDSYRGAPTDGGAWTVGGDCSRRVLRGGSWLSKPQILRSAVRSWSTAGNRFSNAGFRVARTLD